MTERLIFTGPLLSWIGAAGGNWYFITLTGSAAEALSATALMRRLEGMARGWGSLRVTAGIGETRWQTSVFPQKDEGWLLPVKAAVRKRESLSEGDVVSLSLEF